MRAMVDQQSSSTADQSSGPDESEGSAGARDAHLSKAERVARDWIPRLLASVTLANGLLGILSTLAERFPGQPTVLAIAEPFGLHYWSRSLSLAFGFALLYLSLEILERRRVAWWLALAGAMGSFLAQIGRGHLWLAAIAPGLMVALLLAFRDQFTVRSEQKSIVRGIGLMAASVLAALAYGTIGFWLLDPQDFGVNFELVDALVRTLREFTLVGNNDLIAHTRHALWFLESLRVLGAVSGLFAIYSLFRPVAYRFDTLPQQRALARSLLEQYGGTSLDFFKLWPDKSYFFAPDQQCCIAYKTVWGVAVCLGDPVGASQELGPTVQLFLDFCAGNGWEAAFHQVQPDLLGIYRTHGLSVLKIGEEAVVDLERFSSQTVQSKHFRQVKRRLENLGYVFARLMPPHDSLLLKQVQEVSNEWLTLPGHRERGFTLGSFGRDYVSQTPLAVIRDPSGRVAAFANIIPSYRADESTIDLMRHRLDVPNGTMDYLFTELMLLLHGEGYHRFNLGLAPFAGVGEVPDAPVQERAAHYLTSQLGRFFSFKGLRNYKSKFEPLWEDRFLVYQGGPLGLGRAALALTRVTEE
jgi:phosphatidylglycerol lysyltransferase